ncbi:hypothetical protein BDV10DRAFT_174477 [Aspergillus recurvatus]
MKIMRNYAHSLSLLLFIDEIGLFYLGVRLACLLLRVMGSQLAIARGGDISPHIAA